MLTTTGLNFGVRRGLPHLLGICTGFPVMLALIGLGFASLFQHYPAPGYGWCSAQACNIS